jgi:hypothetical protein
LVAAFAQGHPSMRTISVAAITCSALFLSTIGAHSDGAWCANYKNGGTNCGFYSFEQCEAARLGNGGFCYRTLGPGMALNDEAGVEFPSKAGWTHSSRRLLNHHS